MANGDARPLDPGTSDVLEELADGDLEELEPTLQMPVVHSRTSAPPPLPIDARRSSVPPAPPQSGMFRIKQAPERASEAPASASELEQQIQRLQAELHERSTQIDRLRLAVGMREDRLRELERALAGQRARADELERTAQAQAARMDALEHALRERTDSARDDLKRISGIGPVFARKLEAMGIRRFEQVAALTPEGIVEVATALGIPVRRIETGGWVAKAVELAALERPPIG